MSQSSQLAQAAQILLSRREARRSLREWAKVNEFVPAKHHELIIDKLEAASRREVKRLMLFLPPGSAKSTYSSVLFPPFFLAQNEGTSILTASYSADLATQFGRRCRNLIEQNEKILGYSLAKDSQAADNWGTSHRCVYFCAGVGGRIAGHRADLGLIDDPIGSIADADSQLKRNSVYNWYEWNFLPRLRPNAVVIIITTRWHEDDLAGRLLAKEPNKWTVIELPMEAKPNDVLGRQAGERLWPEYFTEDMVLEAKSNPRKWNGAYQQCPTPETGEFFKAEWISTYTPNQLPTDLRYYVGSDHALTDRELASGDSSCFVVVGVDSNHNIWVLPECFWGQVDTGKQVDAMLDLMRKYNPVTWFAGKDHITKSIGPFLEIRQREEQVYNYVEPLSEAKDKPTKAAPLQGRMKMGMVLFPSTASWWPDALHELLMFPNGTHDDFVDGLEKICRGLPRLQKATVTKNNEGPFLPAPTPITFRELKQKQLTSDRREKFAKLGL